MNVMIAYVVCALVWGTTWFAIRVCIGDGGYPTFAAAALRFTLAAMILLPVFFTKIAKPGPKGSRQWTWLIVAGLLNAVGYSLVYIGEESVPGGLAAVLFGTEPLAIALLVTITRTERVSRAELVGALIAMMGIGVIFLDRVDVSTSQALGIVLILCAVVVSGVYSMIMKKHASNVHPLASAAVFLTATSVALWVAAIGAGWESALSRRVRLCRRVRNVLLPAQAGQLDDHLYAGVPHAHHRAERRCHLGGERPHRRAHIPRHRHNARRRRL
jgi:drug/metabolite transporter (DMT)-like permease